MSENNISDSYKYCEICGKPLAANYDKDICPYCVEEDLFHQVKEFIRANDVTEYDVAYEFHISVRKVKRWIQEGRIEYKEGTPVNGIMNIHCKVCGKPVTFGTICPKCMKQSTMPSHDTPAHENEAEEAPSKIGRISFLSNPD